MKNRKPVSKIINSKTLATRKRNDVLVIMVAVIGIAGSILVFNSYASKKLSTDTPGEYSIINILAQSGTKYVNASKVKAPDNHDVLHTNNDASINTPFTLPSNNFCIYGWNRAGANMDVSTNDGSINTTPIVDNLASDYPLSSPGSRKLQCYSTQGKFGDKTNLIITSDNLIWIDKIVTE
jgi:hypothetical protein